MGRPQQAETTLSFFTRRKSTQVLIFLGLTGFVLVHSNCGTSLKQGELRAPENFPKLKTEAITDIGVNKRPQLSPDSKKLLWISGQRPDHEQFQAYIMDIESKKRRRITYQDGDVYGVNMNSTGKTLYYSSTTDEIKEDSDYIRKALDPNATSTSLESRKNFMDNDLKKVLPRTELYESSLNGYDIERLTKHLGFDGMITIHPKKNRLVYTTLDKDKLKLKSLNLSGYHSTSNLRNNAYFPKYNKDGSQLAWIEKESDFTRIFIGKEDASKAEAVYSANTDIVDILWSADSESIYFSMQLSADNENLEIFRYRMANKCLQRITYNQAKDLAPALNADDSVMYFESDRFGSSQILSLSLKELPPCEPEMKKLE